MNRRGFIGLVAGIESSLAGCLSWASLGDEPTESPDQSPPATPTLTGPCQRDLGRITTEFTVEDGPFGGFGLTLSKESVRRGGTITARVWNVTLGEQTAGNKTLFDIQRRTTDGWQSIFRIEDAVWTAEAPIHLPREGFTWTVRLTRHGLTRIHDGGPNYFVCEPLSTGTYRFVFFGVTKEGARAQTNYALGEAFTVTEV